MNFSEDCKAISSKTKNLIFKGGLIYPLRGPYLPP